MTTVIVSVPDEQWARLVDLSESYGLPLGETLVRLLDRDPHDHEHRCPTCVRQANREAAAAEHHGQDPLWAEEG